MVHNTEETGKRHKSERDWGGGGRDLPLLATTMTRKDTLGSADQTPVPFPRPIDGKFRPVAGGREVHGHRAREGERF